MIKQTILVVDDEDKMRRVLEIMIANMGHHAVSASNALQAIEVLKTMSVDLVLSDFKMTGMNGIELLKSIRQQENDVPFVIMTAYGTIESAVEAIKFGACEYIVRPIDMNALEITINRILAERRVRHQNDFLKDEVEKGWGEFVGQSVSMQKVYELITKVAPVKTTVLITGETGTGKELVARAIHKLSTRKDELFVPINCAAIPAEIMESEIFGYQKGAFTGAVKDRIGKFERANGGTLFLDEITEMPIALQAKLLRVLQEGVIEKLGSNQLTSVDVRIVAATNRDPRQAISEGKLREDLFYRINVFNIHLPPLRERKEDITALVSAFIKQNTSKCKVLESAMSYLERYDWPGNVRELQNIVERALVLSRDGVINIEHLPYEISSPPSPKNIIHTPEFESLDMVAATNALEKMMITEALKRTDNNKSKASRLLEISERSLWYKLKNYGFD